MKKSESVSPTKPERIEKARAWATIKHGTVTPNQRRVLLGIYERTSHGLSEGRAHQARRTLILRGLIDVEGGVTPAGRELVRGFRR